MKGYLQRMVSGAISPGGSIRPITGSVYSSLRPHAGVEAPAVEPNFIRPGHDAPEPHAAPDAGPPGPSPQPVRQSEVRATGKIPAPHVAPEIPFGPSVEGPVGEERERGPRVRPPEKTAITAPHEDREGTPRAPTQPEPVERRPSPIAGRSVRLVPAREATPLSGSSAPAAQESAPVGAPAVEAESPVKAGPPENSGDQPAGAGKRPYVPLVAGDFPAPPARDESLEGPRESHAAQRPRERAPAATVRSAARQGPDEIQINIGRVEVVAAPPPAMRPAAQKAQRKAPSLDDYLRRRNSRIR